MSPAIHSGNVADCSDIIETTLDHIPEFAFPVRHHLIIMPHRSRQSSTRSPAVKSASKPAMGRDRKALQALAGEVAIRQFTAGEQQRLRQEIRQQILMTSRSITRGNFDRISSDDVGRMIRLYDDMFAGGKILQQASREGIRFKLSKRMTSAGGKLVTQYHDGSSNGRRSFELVLSSNLLFQTFEDNARRPIEVGGCVCHDRLDAMQRIAEHEFVHLTEILIWNDGNCNEPRFQSIARRYFGHTDYQHNLVTQRERAAAKFNIRVGDLVSFRADGKVLHGKVNRITRRATVLVPDAKGERFSDGNHYVRYYVPLERLKRASA